MRTPVYVLMLSLAAGAFLTPAQQAFSQIVINEIMYDPVNSDDAYGEWIEFLNLGTEDIDIDTWILHCHGDFVHQINNGGPLIIPAGGYLLLGRSTDTLLNGNVPVAYGYGNDIPLGGGDAIWLYDTTGALVDSVDYGVPGFPDPSGATLELYNPLMDNLKAESWGIAITAWDGGDLGTPGGQNSIYSQYFPGDVIITEIMHNPMFVADILGEWFEVYNPADYDVDMAGWMISDDGGQTFTVTGSFVIPSHEFGIFTVNDDQGTNGGIDFPRVYDWGTDVTFSLSRSDEITMRNGVLTMNEVKYDPNLGWPDPEGASMILISFEDPNWIPQNWTVATVRESSYTGFKGDLGSPGTLGTGQNLGDASPPHIVFARPVTSRDVDVFFTEDVDAATAQDRTNYVIDNGIGNPIDAVRDQFNHALVHLSVIDLTPDTVYTLTVSNVEDLAGNAMEPEDVTFTYTNDALPGDVIITEFMSNPTAVGDPDGEWFELYNRTLNDIDLNGWEIKDNGGENVIVTGSVMIPAKGFAVFTVNDDSATNGGFIVAYDSCGCPCSSIFDWGTAGDFSLENNDEIILMNGSIQIDSVGWTGTWPAEPGRSTILKYFAYDNSISANWDTAKVREGGYVGEEGDLGSPGTLGTGQNTGSPFLMSMSIHLPNQVIPIGGDTVQATMKFFNPLSANARPDMWITLFRPDGTTRTLMPPLTVFIPADMWSTGSRTLIFRATEPPGVYYVNGAIGAPGAFPDDTLAFVSVQLRKPGFISGGGNDVYVLGQENGIPEQTFMDNNYPNPFNPTTVIRYGLHTDAQASLKVYDLVGREVTTLVDEWKQAGYYSVIWDGRNSSGRQVSTGVYFYRLVAGSVVSTQRMVFAK